LDLEFEAHTVPRTRDDSSILSTRPFTSPSINRYSVGFSGAVKKSEIILDQARIMPLDVLFFKYGKGLAALAPADFNRTKALADLFDRYELRIMARQLIVKGILSPDLTKSIDRTGKKI